MRILLLHNRYQQRGGEDAIFEQELALLRHRGHKVMPMIFDNSDISGNGLKKLRGGLQALSNRASARRLENAITDFNPDVLHIHNLFYVASPSVIRAAKRRGLPVVMTLHNYRLVCAGGMLFRTERVPCEQCLTQRFPLKGIYHACFRDSRIQTAQLAFTTSLHNLLGTWQRVDRFITLTDFARQKILQSALGLHADQVVVKPNFVPDLGYVPYDERQSSFLFVGRLSAEKGIDTLLAAARLSAFPLEIIGTGPLRSVVEEAARTLSHVTYLGEQPREVVIERFKRSCAVIVPSLWYEGLPTVILEAFSTGTPVLCSDQENLNKIVHHERNGLLFKVNSPKALVDAIGQFQRKTDQQSIYGRNGRVAFEAHYSESVVAQQLEDVYQSVLVNADKRMKLPNVKKELYEGPSC